MTYEPTELPRTVMWRRIDVVGMDACAYRQSADGYSISGTALFLDGTEPAKLAYRVHCNADWSSQSAWVGGWVGSEEKEFSLMRDAVGNWSVNDEKIDGVAGLLDIDLGFTPATNTNAIRRLVLEVGEQVETVAVWLDTEQWRVKPLRQVYRRLSETEFAYRSLTHDYTANLVTDDFGIVRLYPQLWAAVPAARA